MEAACELLAENRPLLPAVILVILVALPCAGYWIGTLVDWSAGRWVGVGFAAEFVPPTALMQAAPADVARPPQLVIFFHLAKCAGTAVRELFQSSGQWGILPYCQPAPLVLEMLANMSAPPPYLFWEQHCTPSLPLLHAILNSSRHLPSRPHVTSFIVLRDPIDLALSDYAYFPRSRALALWARKNAELLLFGERRLGAGGMGRRSMLGFPRPRRALPKRGNRSLLSRAE